MFNSRECFECRSKNAWAWSKESTGKKYWLEGMWLQGNDPDNARWYKIDLCSSYEDARQAMEKRKGKTFMDGYAAFRIIKRATTEEVVWP